jgi:ABC transporter substrate binding protein
MNVTSLVAVLIALLAVAMLIVPLAGEAQQAASLPRIGFLNPASLSDPRVSRVLQAFRQGLRELGYVEGQNIAIEFRWAEGKDDRLPGNPANPNYGPHLRHAHDAARALGIRLQPMEVRDPSAIDTAFASITTERAGAVIVLTDTVLLDHRTRIADHAIRRRLPTVFGVSEFAEAGGLLAYGPSLAEGYRRTATYVDKIVKDATPADLPIEQPSKLELVVNMNAAKALGLTIPQSVLLRADEVIR